MNMRQLISQQLVIDFDCFQFVLQPMGDEGDAFNQLLPLSRREIKEFRRMAIENEDRPAEKELIFV